MDSFSWTVPNGKYTVKLHFAETFEGITGPGERCSRSTCRQGVQGLRSVGQGRRLSEGLHETVPVEVTDGKIKVTFTPRLRSADLRD